MGTRQVQITIDDAPGLSNGEMRALLAQYNLKTMFFVEGEFVQKHPGMWLWDVDSLDWKHRGNTKAIIDEVEGGLARSQKALSDVLFHDKHTSVVALRALLPRLKNNGFQLVNFP